MLFDPMVPVALTLLVFAVFAAFILFTGLRAPRGRRLWPTMRRLMIAVALVLIAVRPGVPGLGERTTVITGTDVYIVMDTTGSVAAEDYLDGSTRLSGMKSDATRILAEFAGAKFSLVTFDTVALVRVPLTTDATAVQSALDVVEPELTLYSHGTSISESKDVLLATLLENASAHPERQRIVFYLGDGEQTIDGEPESFAESAPYVQGGAVLGYGTAAGGRMKENNGPFDEVAESGGETDAPAGPPEYIQDRSVSPRRDALSNFDEQNLQVIAADLGVDYFHRTGDSALPVTVEDVPGQPETVQASVRTVVELYWVAALLVFALLLWEGVGIALALVALRRPTGVVR